MRLLSLASSACRGNHTDLSPYSTAGISAQHNVDDKAGTPHTQAVFIVLMKSYIQDTYESENKKMND